MSATQEDLAAAIGVEVEAIEGAVEAGAAEPLVDTAKQNGSKEWDRPTDPSLRSLAFEREQFEAFRDAVG